MSGRSYTDCVFYLKRMCVKHNCPYRHEPATLNDDILCSHWLDGACFESHCPRRHLNLNRPPTLVPCWDDLKPEGCTKKDCLYKHKPKCNTVGIQTDIPDEEKSIESDDPIP